MAACHESGHYKEKSLTLSFENGNSEERKAFYVTEFADYEPLKKIPEQADRFTNHILWMCTELLQRLQRDSSYGIRQMNKQLGFPLEPHHGS